MLRSLIVICFLTSGRAGDVASQAPYVALLGDAVRGQPYRSYSVPDSLGRAVGFYLSEWPAGKAVPLVVYVHGSGHRSLFVRRDGRLHPTSGHATVVDVVAGRAAIVIVEKPGIPPFQTEGDTAPDRFRQEHTLERWAEAVAAALLAARRLPGIDTSRALLVGHSEGGLVAARVAGRLPEVTHVALLAAGGPSQLFDLLLLARRGAAFFRISPDSGGRERYVLAQWDSIRRHPTDWRRSFYGHPYRRWATFLASSPLLELEGTQARVFLAQGGSDAAVTRESFDALAAHLWSRGRDPVVRLVAGADHSFVIRDPEGRVTDGWAAILTSVVEWFLSP